jgi:5'(3')-deoxyribonucleotidase
MIIAVDLDDVLANTLENFIDFHNSTYKTSLKFSDFKSYALHDIIGLSFEEEAKRLEQFDKSKFFNKIKPLEGAQTAISQLSKKNKIVVITARTKSVATKTKRWLKKYFPEIDEVVFISQNYMGFIKTKAEVCKEFGAKVIIEDKTSFVNECANKGIKVMMLDYPWNQNVNGSSNIVRVRSWDDILKKLR